MIEALEADAMEVAEATLAKDAAVAKLKGSPFFQGSVGSKPMAEYPLLEPSSHQNLKDVHVSSQFAMPRKWNSVIAT